MKYFERIAMTHEPFDYRGHSITIWTGENGSGTWTWSYVVAGENIEVDNIGRRLRTQKEAVRDAKIAAEAKIDGMK
ncbi:hypothetical protein [Janthinobacterium sp. RT4P48]|uniref:hypothetical protein n=1 Tax=Janthinobacterium sp. RT4P48 TaxID=3424188 RepID=UPI003F25E11A